MPQDKVVSAPVDRSRFSLMVVPFSSDGTDLIRKLESDAGYREAVSDINSALINRGYRNTMDFKTHMEIVNKRHVMTEGKTWSGGMKKYIEEAETDMVVYAEIFWTDPPGDPRNRQARISLKAVDKYTGAVYADNAFITSAPREYPGLAVAVDHALTKDGAEQFAKFLGQLDASYSVLFREGRSVNVKFELGTTCKETMETRIGDERLSDKLEACLKDLSLHGRCRPLGSSAEYVDFAVQVPIIDEKGAFVSPNVYLKKEVDRYSHQLGFEVTCSQVNYWINFILLSKSRQDAKVKG
jgi:hypothetical protein